MNVLDKLPKRLHAEARKALKETWNAPTREECQRSRDTYAAQLRAQGQSQAAACLERDWEDFVTFYDFPEEHWDAVIAVNLSARQFQQHDIRVTHRRTIVGGCFNS